MSEKDLLDELLDVGEPHEPTAQDVQSAWDRVREGLREAGDPIAAVWGDSPPEPPPPDGTPQPRWKRAGLLAGAVALLGLLLALLLRPSPPQALSGELSAPLQMPGVSFEPLNLDADGTRAELAGTSESPDLHLHWGYVDVAFDREMRNIQRTLSRAAVLETRAATYRVSHNFPGTAVLVRSGEVRLRCLAVHTDEATRPEPSRPYPNPKSHEVESERTLSAGESATCAPRDANELLHAWDAEHKRWKKSGDRAALQRSLLFVQRALTATATTPGTRSEAVRSLWRTHLDLGDRSGTLEAALGYLARAERPRRDFVFQKSLVLLGDDCDDAAPLLRAAWAAGDVEIPEIWRDACGVSGVGE